MITTPGCPGAPVSSAISASLTISTRELNPIRFMMPRTIAASFGRSTPAMPRQMAAGAPVRSPSASSIT
jgi:hypothetical protein